MADLVPNNDGFDDDSLYVRPQDMTLRMADGSCLNCYGINFEEFFSLTALPVPPIASIQVQLAQIASEYCWFCKLLIDAGSQLAGRAISAYRGQQIVTFFFERVHHQGIWKDSMFKRPSSVVLRVTLRPAPWPLQISETYFTIYPIFKDPIDDGLHSGRLINSTSIDLDVARRWLGFCDGLHGSNCVADSYLISQKNLPVFRVIDVQDMCVKTEQSSCRYVALSYVWGKATSLLLLPSNIDRLYQKDSLRALEGSIAKTIQDAIHVVREIGERYIWVDCLCILQGDEKSTQIAVMDQIFGSACLTIVAACGVDASEGLSGVHENSRQIKQVSWPVTEQLTLAVALSAPNEMNNAHWSSRGWTLQEALLGKRFLIFRDGQVFWQCRQGMEFEDTLAENKAFPFQGLTQLPQRRTNLPLESTVAFSDSTLLRAQQFIIYTTILQDYTKRHLTESSDVLNAFGGLSKIFESLFGSRMMSGLPESYLDIAVLWQPKVTLTRRDVQSRPFPSWSWAGWIGEVRYPEVNTKERGNQEGVIPLLRWFVITPKARHVVDSKVEPLNKTGIGIDEKAFNCDRSMSTCMWLPIFEDLLKPGIPRDFSQSRDSPFQQYLAFWTSAAYLVIVSKEGQFEARDQNTESENPPLEYQIRKKSGYIIGHVTMNGLSPMQTEEGRHEFIVISGSQHLGFNTITWKDNFSPEPAEWEMYNVMLVEWDEPKKIAYRVGLGRVMRKAWTSCNPKSKFVVLG